MPRSRQSCLPSLREMMPPGSAVLPSLLPTLICTYMHGCVCVCVCVCVFVCVMFNETVRCSVLAHIISQNQFYVHVHSALQSIERKETEQRKKHKSSSHTYTQQPQRLRKLDPGATWLTCTCTCKMIKSLV